MQIVVMAWSRNCHRFREDVADQKKAEKFEAAAFNSISFNQRADNVSAKGSIPRCLVTSEDSQFREHDGDLKIASRCISTP